MAQNISLMGADYTGVPAVELPKTGGGTATFTDVTGTTATAADVAQGKVFYAADGSETTGTASGGGGGAKTASGKFVGAANYTQTFNLGFKPDLIAIKSNVDYYTAGWVGIGHAFIVKNSIALIVRHNNTSTDSPLITSNALLGGEYGEYGDIGVSGTAKPYGTYSNGTFTLTNTQNLAATRFIADQEYEWVAIQYIEE